MTTAPRKAEDEAAELVDGDRLLLQHERREDQGEERRQGLQDGCQGGADRPFGPGDEHERDRDVEDAHDGDARQHAPLARDARARRTEQHEQPGDADGQSPGHQGEWLEAALDADLDEEVRAAPGEGKGDEDEPQEG